MTSVLRLWWGKQSITFINTHRGHDCQPVTILVTPTDRIGRVVVHYVQFLASFTPVKWNWRINGFTEVTKAQFLRPKCCCRGTGFLEITLACADIDTLADGLHVGLTKYSRVLRNMTHSNNLFCSVLRDNWKWPLASKGFFHLGDTIPFHPFEKKKKRAGLTNTSLHLRVITNNIYWQKGREMFL